MIELRNTLPENRIFKKRNIALVGMGLLSMVSCAGDTAESQSDKPEPGAVVSLPETSARPAKAQGFGYDVSWPQCNQALPEQGDFAVVGINGNLPNEFNPCYAEQATWARGLKGTDTVPAFTAYVTAASPGRLSASWPTDGLNKYGECSGEEDEACAYEYGKLRATEDLRWAADALPKIVFIDVELEYSWDISPQLNKATLDAMGDVFKDRGIEVGVYSNDKIWYDVTGGGVDKGHSLVNAPVWILGAHSPQEASALCDTRGFTGGRNLMAQIAAKNGGTKFDQNYPC